MIGKKCEAVFRKKIMRQQIAPAAVRGVARWPHLTTCNLSEGLSDRQSLLIV
jgi:hypothetical protein